jgi:hypothetical protein
MRKHILALGLLMAWDARAAAQPITFNFEWPNGLTCRVENQESQSAGEEARRFFTLRANTMPDGGTRIEPSKPEWHDAKGKLTRAQAAARARFWLASKLPPFVVGSAGTLVALQDHERASVELREAFGETIAADSMSRAEIDDVLARLGGEDALLTNISELWTSAVEHWLDFHYESKPLVDEGSLEIDGSPVPLKLLVTLDMVAKPPCRRGAREYACVELSREEKSDPESLKQIVAALIARADKATSERIHALGMDTRVVTLTERDTLVPHEITTTRTLKFGRHDGSEPAEIVQRQFWRFDCDEVAPP